MPAIAVPQLRPAHADHRVRAGSAGDRVHGIAARYLGLNSKVTTIEHWEAAHSGHRVGVFQIGGVCDLEG